VSDARPTLRAGPLEVQLLPPIGGSIVRFDRAVEDGRQPMLRGTDAVIIDVLAATCFPRTATEMARLGLTMLDTARPEHSTSASRSYRRNQAVSLRQRGDIRPRASATSPALRPGL
jgi:hypothetical protein